MYFYFQMKVLLMRFLHMFTSFSTLSTLAWLRQHWNQLTIQRPMQKALSPKSRNFWTHFSKVEVRVKIKFLKHSLKHSSTQHVFQLSVYLDPLYIFPVFDFWYICSAITAFYEIKTQSALYILVSYFNCFFFPFCKHRFLNCNCNSASYCIVLTVA